ASGAARSVYTPPPLPRGPSSRALPQPADDVLPRPECPSPPDSHVRAHPRLDLRMRPFHLLDHPVERVDIGLCRSDDDIGVGALAIDDAPATFDSHGDLTLRIGAAGDVAHGVELQGRPALDD